MTEKAASGEMRAFCTIDQRAGDAGPEGGGQIDQRLHAPRIDADGAGRLLVVADGGEAETLLASAAADR